MARLKFLVFAIVVLGLWGYHLVLVSPVVAGRARAEATATALAAPTLVALKIESQRSALQAAMLRLAASPAVLNPGPTQAKAAPTADRFNAIRAVLSQALPEHQTSLVVVVTNESGALGAQGGSDPGAAPEGLDVTGVAARGALGATVLLSSMPHLFYATPLLVADKNEVRTGGMVLVGLPLLPDGQALVEAASKELQLQAVGIVANGAVTASAGQKAALEKFLKLKVPLGPAEQGAVTTLGPLALPLFVEDTTLAVGVNREIVGTPFSVVAIAGSRTSLEALASYQKFALAGLAGLVLLTIIVLIVIGSVSAEAHEQEQKEEDKAGKEEQHHTDSYQVPPAPVRDEPPPQEVEPLPPEPTQAGGPEVSPDDFQFPNSSPSQFVVSSPSQIESQPQAEPSVIMGEGVNLTQPTVMLTPDGPTQDPFEHSPDLAQDPFGPPVPAAFEPSPATDFFQAAPAEPTRPGIPLPPEPREPSRPSVPLPAEPREPSRPGIAVAPHHPFAPTPMRATTSKAPALQLSQPEQDGDRTVAYPAFSPAQADPFAADGDYNPDATRVAAVPQELIRAARSGGATGEQPMASRPQPPPPQMMSVPRVQAVSSAPSASEEDRHYQDVYRDFIATREKCGEGAEGLPFEKFKAKLLKNKELLMQKHACRTVRFQVYVKEGKAALKAIPVKD